MLSRYDCVSKIRSAALSDRRSAFLSRSQVRFNPFPIPEGFLETNTKNVQGRQPRRHQIPKEIRLDSKFDLSKSASRDRLSEVGLRGIDDDYKERSFLTNVIENHVSEQAPVRFRLDTSKSTTKFQATASETFYPSMLAHISKDKVDVGAVSLLWPILNNLLPPDPLNATFFHPRGSWGLETWSPAQENMPIYQSTLPLGWHMPMFPTLLVPTSILPDGTDSRFLPGPAEIWPYRLWASGSIRWCTTQPHVPRFARVLHHLLERPVALKVDGDTSPTGASVTVRKSFHALMGKKLGQKYTESGVLDMLAKEPSETPDHHNGPYLVEDYTLRFSRAKPTTISRNARIVRPPGLAKLNHTLTFNRHHLFCWSAVTQNAHLIHLDPTYAREQYGAKDLLVHGPFTVFMILEWFRRALTTQAVNRLDKFTLRSIDYKILLPIFVDEPVTFCAKPMLRVAPSSIAAEWRLWIEKEADNGLKTCAFMATVKLDTTPWDGKVVEMRQNVTDQEPFSAERSVHAVESNGGTEESKDEFRSPFFS